MDFVQISPKVHDWCIYGLTLCPDQLNEAVLPLQKLTVKFHGPLTCLYREIVRFALWGDLPCLATWNTKVSPKPHPPCCEPRPRPALVSDSPAWNLCIYVIHLANG